jgi:hypothetical protein
MTDEIRRPTLIQKELSQVAELIRDNEDIINQYPDRFSLRLHLMSLQNRQDQLLVELKNSYNKLQMETFDIDVNGKFVETYRISTEVLGNLLITFQRVLTSIAAQSESKEPLSEKGPISQSIIDNSRIDVVATCPAASVRVVFSSNKPEITESKATTALRRFNRLLDCEDRDDLIKQEIKDLGPRTIKRYKELLNVIYKTESDIKLYDAIIPEGFETKVITSELAKRIWDKINSEEAIPDKEECYSGTIKGLSLLKYSFQFLVEDSGEVISGSFDPKLSESVKNSLDKHSSAIFKIATKQNELTEELYQDYELLGFEK